LFEPQRGEDKWDRASRRPTSEISGGCKPSAGVTCYARKHFAYDKKRLQLLFP